MKLLLFLFLPIFCHAQYGHAYEPIIWNEPRKTSASEENHAQTDTTWGRIVYANEFRVLVEKGVKVINRETGRSRIAPYHYITKIGEAIEPKNVIKFIPND